MYKFLFIIGAAIFIFLNYSVPILQDDAATARADGHEARMAVVDGITSK